MHKINRTTVFLMLTFVISYSLAGIYKLLGGQYHKFSGVIIAVVYMFIPMISAIIVEKGIHKEKIKTSLFISFDINKWFLAAWLITPILSFGTFGISLLLKFPSF